MTRVRRSKDESRENILKESLKLIGQHGWTAVSFQMIAKRCRMSPANIVYHFATRESLLLALLNRISENNWAIVAAGLKPEMNAFERLLVHFQKNVEWARRFPEEAQIIVQIYANAGSQQEFADVFRVMIERAEARIEEYLFAGQREGLFHFSEEPDLMARFAHDLLVGAFIKTFGSILTKPVAYRADDWQEILGKMLVYKRRR